MATFLFQLVLFGAITMASTLPLVKVNQIARIRHKHRQWAISALTISVLAAGIAWISRILREACLAERNNGCVDIGGAGMQFLLIGGFVAFALSQAYFRYTN